MKGFWNYQLNVINKKKKQLHYFVTAFLVGPAGLEPATP